ncbi:MAG: hypothetical protein FJW34_21605, partial [Acidobacteria bacterium]|nr:hypothetical protein [Acidobacteriota bacterium]
MTRLAACLWMISATVLGLAAPPPARITIDYPEEGSIFPPDMEAPTFLWRDDAESAKAWMIEISFAGAAPIRIQSAGEPPRVGEIDPRAVSATNQPPQLTPRESAAHTWKPDTGTWEAVRQRSVKRPATVTITGFADENRRQAVSRGRVSIQTSKDPVGAPIFYRDVPL